MKQFWTGFLVASLLWGAAGAYAAYDLGLVPLEAPPPEAVADAGPPDAGVEEAPPPRRRRPRRDRRRRAREGTREGQPPSAGVTSDDDLREDEMRILDLEGGGGTAQLSPAQLDAVFSESMPAIRRCLILAASEDPIRGTLVFATRIRPDGSVEGVSLRGPREVRTGEAGDCMRRTARSWSFPSYDGPPMVARFPLELE